MRVLSVIVIAGCGFAPSPASNPGAIDAHGPEDRSDASVVRDANEFHDAPPVLDAPVVTFDPAQCPATYTNLSITASPNTRYRIVTTTATVKAQSNACNADHPGWTHLVVLDTVQEAQQLRSHMGNNIYYVGAVQPPGQATPSAGWLELTGAAVPAPLWQTGQPNDNADVENNEQNFAAVDDATGLLNDVAGTVTYQAVCECDGQAIGAAALAALNQ